MRNQGAWIAAAAIAMMALASPVMAGDAHHNRVPAGDARAEHHAAAPASTPEMAPAGVGAIDSAMGTEIAHPGVPAWLALPRSIAAPDSSIAWIFGIGFLGYVILRRVRAAPDY